MRKNTIIKKISFLVAISAFAISIPAFGQEDDSTKTLFDNEIMKYSVNLKGFPIGALLMMSKKHDNTLLQISSRVTSFKAIESMYYVQGDFGGFWNFQEKKSYLAYEDIYQGKTYQKRTFKFENNKVRVIKHEKKFSEYGYPHTGKILKDIKDSYVMDLPNSHDLLGLFYYLRTTMTNKPKEGTILDFTVVVAGRESKLMIKFMESTYINIPSLGGNVKVFHVLSGIVDPNQNKMGGNIIFATETPLDIYITDDELGIPVRITTTVPIIGQVSVELVDYNNPNFKKK